MTHRSGVVLSAGRIVQVNMPGLPVSDPVDITVVDGRIVKVEPYQSGGVDVVDLDGRHVLPGMVNAHDHLYSKELRYPVAGMDLAAMRRQIDARDEIETFAVMVANALGQMADGTLVIRDLGARYGLNTKLSKVFSDGLLFGPRVVAAGRPIVMTGGHVWTFGREADGPDECRKAVREQRKAGAEVIKVMASGGLSNFPHEDYTVSEFTDAELEAIVSEAAKLGIPTCAHAFGVDAVAAAIRAGIDGVEHGVHLDDATVASMVAQNISYVPTMANMARIASPAMNADAGVPERARQFTSEVVEPQVESVNRAAAAGVRIGVGTDSTGTYAEELAALHAAGMTTEAIIRAATIDGAKICRVDAGVVETGKLALLNVYEDDPRNDLSNLTRPSSVFAGNSLLERSQLKSLVSQ
jgi:imidazolonepropionase-like amidohydrolase